MTPAPPTAAFTAHEARFRAVAPEHVESAHADDPTGDAYLFRQPRDGEELRGKGVQVQLAAIYTSRWFWDFCRTVFPNNNVHDPDAGTREGAPQHFPDWLLFLLTCYAGVAGISTMKNAVTQLMSATEWATFAAAVDPWVPPDMSAPYDLLPRTKKRDPLAKPGTPPNAATTSYPAQRPIRPGHARPAPPESLPPAPHHLDYFVLRWRGVTKATKTKPSLPFPVTHPYYGMRDKAFAAFRRLGIDQAQGMGLIDPTSPFAYARPDRNLFVGADGVVFPVAKEGVASAALHETGVGKVYGSKFTIFSIRVNGQYLSRVILDLAHTHKTHPGSHRSESDAVLDVMPGLLDLSQGGIRGLLVDSAVRGNAVTTLHRAGIRVINYPHAASNPEGGKDNRLNATRVEKSKLRWIATHTNHLGVPCDHPVFAVGGEFMELVMSDDGTDTVRALAVTDYEHRVEKNGLHRERLTLSIPDCPFGDGFVTKVPLFHDNPVSTAPRGQNWGEVVRLYPPGSWQFKFLYGARNDTESRHADLKARAKHLPKDVRGQELRLVGAAMAHNAIAWQVHLQAHGQPNVLDHVIGSNLGNTA
jgi:hypothetical protein